MDRLERLIRDIRKQLSPYQHEHDTERGSERWKVDERDYITAWVAEQMNNCHTHSGCDRKGMCVFYNYRDIAKKNYDICREIRQRIENGEIRCAIGEEDGE